MMLSVTLKRLSRCVIAQLVLGRLLLLRPWNQALQSLVPVQQAIKNGFSQAAARAELPQQAPVPAQPLPCLVTKVDLRHNAEALTLLFFGADGLAAELTLRRQDVRQWLNILYDAWRAAGWPAGLWPEWMGAQAASSPAAPQARLH